MDKNLRKERLASVVHAATAEFFVECGQDWGVNVLPLVDQVFVSPDLHHIEIWISLSPWKKEKAQHQFEVVKKHLGELKKELATKIELRRFPEIELKLSDPESTFRILDIFGTLRSHGNTSSGDKGDITGSEEDPTDGSSQS